MNIESVGRGGTYLFPKDANAVRIAVMPGVDNGVAAAIKLDTDSLGSFVIPLDKWQLGVITGVSNVLLRLDERQISELRACLVREQQEEKDKEK